MSLNVLLIANPVSPLSTDDQWVSDRLTTAGHTVTARLDTASGSPSTGFDLVLMCRSASPTNFGTKYDSFTHGAVGLGPEPHSLYSSAAFAASTGAQSTIYVLPAANGDFLAAGATGTTTVTTVAAAWLYVLDSTLGSGSVKVLVQNSGTTTRICGSHYETNAILSDGSTSAPGRLVYLGMSSGYANSNSTQQAMFDAAVSWAAGGVVAPTATAGSQTKAVLSTVTLSGSAAGITGTASWSWNHVSGPSSNGSLSSTTAQNPTYTAPTSATTPDVWALTVTDSGTGLSSGPANGTITYTNAAPTASTGGPYTVQATGTPTSTTFDVNLTGASSTDPEGSSLTHSWRVVSTTSGSATMINPTSVTPILRADKYGCVVTIGNIVTDSGGVASTEATTTVTVYPVAYKWYTHNGVLMRRQRFTAHTGVLV